MRFPLASNIIRRGILNNTFGMVRQYADGRRKAHQGWDLHAPVGTDVFAVEAGMVEIAETRGALGRTVVQSFSGPNGAKWFAVYAHLDTISVSVGDRVSEGAKVGTVGTTGNAKGMTGAEVHLHFEFRTELLPGTGLRGRIDPVTIFGGPPYRTAVPATPVPTAAQQPR
jgi:murein DD-endopeptidase MepM/ murein hydrolase activator NlpD